jgi:hypothetical protein
MTTSCIKIFASECRKLHSDKHSNLQNSLGANRINLQWCPPLHRKRLIMQTVYRQLKKIHTLLESKASLSAKMSSVSEDNDLQRSFALSAVSLNSVNEKKK